VLVVVDFFTKHGHFIPLRHPFSAASVAKLFMLHVYRLHGMPSSIVSDRDRIFTSQLRQELFSLADVQLRMSSSYLPQSDGQTERLNQTMEPSCTALSTLVDQVGFLDSSCKTLV
jgi:transposase InsO family protein